MRDSIVLAAAGVGGGALVVLLLLRRRRLATLRRCVDFGDLRGRVVLVTGASGGLGQRAAQELALRGASVVLAGRSKAAVAAAAEAIKVALRKAKTPHFSLSQAVFDLSSLRSVQEFAKQFRERYERLDILVNNAGIMSAPFSLTEDAIESHFQVNHLAHFVLTNELLPCLRAAKGRVVNVSSGFYARVSHVDWAYLESAPPSDYASLRPYDRSKLANVLHARELARREPSLSVVSCSPGFVRGTDLGRYTNRFLRILAAPLIWFFSRSLSEGVQTILHCATAPQLASGAYFANCQEEPVSAAVTAANAAELWEVSERLVSESLSGRRFKTTENAIVKKHN